MGAELLTTDVCILGAGPHGLAAAAHLRVADPDLQITVLDPSGEWLTAWAEQFRRAEIETLRSPVVHHPSPDPFALMRYIAERCLASSGLPYNPPTAESFTRFCRALIEHSNLDRPLACSPNRIRSDGRSLELEAPGRTISARHLVVAANPHRRPIPDWVWPMLGQQPELISHGLDVDLTTLHDMSGEQVVVVGGGLTSAHLALGAAARGADVRLVSRRKLSVRHFDTAPGWLGPKYLAAFEAEAEPARRLAIAGRARGGGSIPEWMHDRLQDFDGPGTIELRESAVVRSGEPLAGRGCTLELSDGSVHADRIWLATGTWADAQALKCIRSLLADVASLHGLPIADDHLRLGPHPAFVMGRLATLTLGPAAGNLWGAQRAAHRITEAITGIDLDYHDIERIPATTVGA